MKKILFVIVAALVSLSIFSSCENKQNTTSDQSSELKTYTLTINAAKSLSTKQLVLDGSGNTLNAVWGAGEVVKVYKGSSEIGTLSPLTTGSADAVLSGTVTVAGLAADDWIDLHFGGDLSGQDGSLENIHDWAKAWFQVDHIDGNAIVPKVSVGTADASGSVLFNNWTAIVRFNVKKGGVDLSVSNLTISADKGYPAGASGHKLTITPTTATNQIYVALSNYDGDTAVPDNYEILVTSSVDGNTYTCSASNKEFLRGKYYDITLNVTNPQYFVAGSSTTAFGTAWTPGIAANELVYDSVTGLYSKTFNVSGETVEFKVVRNNSFSNESWPASNYSFKFPSAGTLTVTFNPVTEEVNAVGSTTKTYTVAGAINGEGDGGKDDSVFGKTWDPSVSSNNMTLKNDGSYYKVFTNVASGTVLRFKVCVNNAWAESYGYRDEKTNCGNDGGNCLWMATKDCDIWVYINPGNDHYIYLEEK